jgi:hypothetical protein
VPATVLRVAVATLFALIRSFWFADDLGLLGGRDEAREMYERLGALCNDVGLLSEEYNPKTNRLLGNFPEAFSHVPSDQHCRQPLDGRARSVDAAQSPS